MKVELKNDGGLVRKVPTGLSWTGFIFTGFAMMARGMLGKGLVYLMVVYFIQCMMLLARGAIYLSQGAESAAIAGLTYNLILLIPNFIFLFKLNKWTTRHWLDRGYRPVGEGWTVWGPKAGIQVSDEMKSADVNLKKQSKIRIRDIVGFICIFFVLIVMLASGKKSSANVQRESVREEQAVENSVSMPANASPDAVIGYWKSVNRNEITDEYLYTCFSKTEFLDMWEMKPYKILECRGSKMAFTWSQDSGTLGEFDRKSLIEVYANGNIRLQYDSYSDGYAYERIPKEQWESEVSAQNEDALQMLHNKLQEIADETAPQI